MYFHRFYMFHSFKSFPRYVTACCCLFLAGKVEETPKKCKDIIKTAKSLISDEKFACFGEDPKEEVMTLERILLQTIKFDLQVDHPYGFLVKYAKSIKGDPAKLQKMVQMAWNFVNDSLSTTVCLQWEPEIIAVALIYLASKLSKFDVSDWHGRQPEHLKWWDMFVSDVTMEILEDICHQVLDLYQNANNIDGSENSPPQTPVSKSPTPSKRSPPVSGKSTPIVNKSAPKPQPPLPAEIESNPIPKLVSSEMHYSYPGQHPPMYPIHPPMPPQHGYAPHGPPMQPGMPPNQMYMHYPQGHQPGYYPPPRNNYY